jgi:hypothetical protein
MDYRKIVNKGMQIYPSIISRRAAIAKQQANPLSYQDLAIVSGLGIGHTRALGKALGLIAASCHAFHLPPVNSTVLLKGKKRPGKGIDLATGCSLKSCGIDFNRSIKCNKYPQQLNITIPDPKKPYLVEVYFNGTKANLDLRTIY